MSTSVRCVAVALLLSWASFGADLVCPREMTHTSPAHLYDKTLVSRALAANQYVTYGAILSTGNVMTAETLARNPALSVLHLDATTTTRLQIRHLHNAVAPSSALLIGHFKSPTDSELKPKLDQGLHGAILDDAESLDDVLRFLARLYLAPLGERPVGPARVTGQLELLEEYRTGNNDLFIGGISISTPDGANAIDQIVTAKARGLKLILVDRKALGPVFTKKVEDAARKAAIPLGTRVADRAEALSLYTLGYRHAILGSDLEALELMLKEFDDLPFDEAKEAPTPEGAGMATGDVLRLWMKKKFTIPVGFLMSPDVEVAKVLARKSRTIWVDAEHGPFEVSDVSSIVHAVQRGTHVVVRVTGFGDKRIPEYLQAGAHGIVCPGVEDETQAALFVEMVRRTKADALAVVMIETKKGVENAEKIAAVAGIDVIHEGPYDLMVSLQTTWGSKEHNAARERIQKAARANGLPIGGIAKTRSAAYAAREQGIYFVTNQSEPESAAQVFRRRLAEILAPGDLRVIDAKSADPLHHYVQAVLLSESRVAWQPQGDGTERKVVHYGNDLSVQLVRKRGAVVGKKFLHSHRAGQITILLQGKSRVRVGTRTEDLNDPFDLVVIPPGVEHEFTDLSPDIVVIDLLLPTRP